MGTDYAAVARLLANPARSAVVDALMEGRPLTTGELARIAGVRASTISEHLGELLDGGLVAVITEGRRRYYRLSSAEAAGALEAFSRIRPRNTPLPRCAACPHGATGPIRQTARTIPRPKARHTR